MLRSLLAILGCVACCLLAGRPASAADPVVKFYPQTYTPETTRGDTPIPLHQFTRLARAWEALHPGVRIEFLKNPVGEYRTWMRTQLQGHVAPDIMWAHAVWTNEDTKYGWFVDFDPYLAQPNPYVEPGMRGSVRWGTPSSGARPLPAGRRTAISTRCPSTSSKPPSTTTKTCSIASERSRRTPGRSSSTSRDG